MEKLVGFQSSLMSKPFVQSLPKITMSLLTLENPPPYPGR